MKYRTKNSSELAGRQLRRNDRVRVRFLTDVWPARIVRATRRQAIANLYDQSGKPAGEVLLHYRPQDEVVLPDGREERGLWRLGGAVFSDPMAGLVLNSQTTEQP